MAATPNWRLECFAVVKGPFVNQKILFVDAEPAALDLYRKMLHGQFDLATAVGGENGLASLRNLGPFAIASLRQVSRF
ncbi:MAG: hypothetical protein ACLPOO_16570 [Terriglobales bacterium]